MVPGTAAATVGVARRSMTPVGVCQSRSMTRGSVTPGGSRSAFLSRSCMRGPMPARLVAEANRGMSGCGRMVDGGQTPCLGVAMAVRARARGWPPCDAGAFLFAPAGLYDGPEAAKVAAAAGAVKRPRPVIKAELS